MIFRNRLYQRKPPDRDATLVIIYCEGSKREPQYFTFFKGFSSRINLEIVPADSQGNNSPLGLYQQAFLDILDGTQRPLKYDVSDDDCVWFVIDTDTWGESIAKLRKACAPYKNWYVAQSNSCFEVWLYYHFSSEPAKDIMQDSTGWKHVVDAKVPGGFDSRKHPLLLADAIDHAKQNFIKTDTGEVCYGSTEVYQLGEQIYPLVSSVLEKVMEGTK
ncbi:MAG: RloB family protein [Spirochaetia bacterium]|jgi:hypothetical protein|nr:RloB family protein [Spirochaetia bacterium]